MGVRVGLKRPEAVSTRRVMVFHPEKNIDRLAEEGPGDVERGHDIDLTQRNETLYDERSY